MPARLLAAIPKLASLDVERSLAFFERLGFKRRGSYPDYGICERDGVQVHFWLCQDPRIPTETACRITVEGIEQLFEVYSALGIIHPNGKLERCRVYAAKKDILPGVDLHAGDWVSFYESGAVQRLELIIAPMTMQGVTCKGHQNYFHENGKLKQCELASPDGGEKLVCFDDKGTQKPDCS